MKPDIDNSSSDADVDIAQIVGMSSVSGKRRRYLRWAMGAATVIVAIVVLMQIVGKGNTPNINYETAEVGIGTLSVTVSATGTLEPVNQVEVGSEISGTIKTVQVDFNDPVNQGQVLAVMDTDQQQARVNQAKALLQLAQAKVKQVQATVIETSNRLRRAKELEKAKMCSAEECDAAQASYARAEADLASARAQVTEAQSSLDAQQTTLVKATIHSPISGVVLKRDVEPGQTVAATFQTPVLFLLAEDLTKMELHVNVDEADVGQVRTGQAAEFTVDAYPDNSFPAYITDVYFASQTVDGVVTYETVLRVDNSELLLRPGMTATADILIRRIEDALLLPNAALRFIPPIQEDQDKRDGSLIANLLPRPPGKTPSRVETGDDNKQKLVWTLVDGKAVAIPVITGSTDGIMTEVTGGDIGPGMTLIVDTVSTSR